MISHAWRPIQPLRRAAIALATLLLASATPATAADETGIGRTPPRLSLVEGEVSFWRPDATDWDRARVNTALAPGDQLYSAPNARMELQIGGHAFLRGDGETQIGLESQEPDFVQFKLTSGRIAVDLRQLDRGHTVEVDTPSAAFTLDSVGYYRIDIDADRTRFVSRRGGHAAVRPADGQPIEIEPNEETVVEGGETPHVATNRAPAVDDWDRWNYDRTDQLMAAGSERYMPPGMYGAYDLDRSGNWRVVPTYGRVWVPASVAPGWAPYSTGRWVSDPYYGWTWVDDAPWGWAPYHYGRWVYVDSYWAWAPGPIAVAVPPVYAPALVAFFTPHGDVSVGVGIGVPFVSWVALGWGEPLVPWWGPTFFVGHPWWGGWCGPHGDFHGDHHHYHNFGVHDAVVTVRREQFHGHPFTRVSNVPIHTLEPVHGALPFRSERGDTHGRTFSGVRPPATVLNRSVVTAHPSGAAPALSSRPVQPNVYSRPSFAERNVPAKRQAGPEVSSSKPQTLAPPARFGHHVFEPATNPPAHPVNPAARTTSPVPGHAIAPAPPPQTSNLGNRTFSPRPHMENPAAHPMESVQKRGPAAPSTTAPPPPRFGKSGTFSAPAGQPHVGGPQRGFAPRVHAEAPQAARPSAVPHSAGHPTGGANGPAAGQAVR